MGKESIRLVVNSKKVYFDYFIDEKYEAGIEPSSTEAKLVRMDKCGVKESFVRVDWGEMYICGMYVSPYEEGNVLNKDPLRAREFLLHKYEILEVGGRIREKGYALVPLRVYFKENLVKIEIGLTRGRKNYGKRADIAKKDQRRELGKDSRVKNPYQGKRKVPCDVDMRRYLEFIKEVEGLKSTLRTAWTAIGHQENTTECSWCLALGAAIFCRELPELDREKVMFMCPVHNLGELHTGDTSAALRPDEEEKCRQGQLDVSRATKTISDLCTREIMALCEGYSQGQASGARFAKTMDKAETTMQHSQGANPPNFDYESNLSYGVEYFQENEKLKELRTLADEKISETQHRSLQYG